MKPQRYKEKEAIRDEYDPQEEDGAIQYLDDMEDGILSELLADARSNSAGIADYT